MPEVSEFQRASLRAAPEARSSGGQIRQGSEEDWVAQLECLPSMNEALGSMTTTKGKWSWCTCFQLQLYSGGRGSRSPLVMRQVQSQPGLGETLFQTKRAKDLWPSKSLLALQLSGCRQILSWVILATLFNSVQGSLPHTIHCCCVPLFATLAKSPMTVDLKVTGMVAHAFDPNTPEAEAKG